MLKNFIKMLTEPFILYKWYLNNNGEIRIFYKNNTPCLVASLCEKYGSDKGSLNLGTQTPYSGGVHTYSDYYSRIFDHCRFGVKRVFECGLGTNNIEYPYNMGEKGSPGASLRVWRDYFPNAVVYGGDIDKSVLFEEDRIKTYYLDQAEPETIINFWHQVGLYEFDLMIDDGYHEFFAGICLFENSIDRLKKNGIYIIEDVQLKDVELYRSWFSCREYNVDFISLMKKNRDIGHSTLIVIHKP